MRKIYYYFLIITFILFTTAGFCSARELEVKIPGLSGTTDIVQYRNVLFNFLIGLGVGIAVLSLIIGAAQWIMSAGSPESESNAKKRITGSILGLILLMSSYLIMKTINPELTSPANPQGLPVTSGVYLTDGNTTSPCPESVADVSKLPEGFNKIVYQCGKSKPEEKPILWVRMFPKTDLGGWTDPAAKVVEKQCDGGAGIDISNAKSFMLDIERPGLYLYNDSGAGSTTSRSMQILTSQREMDERYKKNTKSFRIIDDPKNNIYYGVLFHEEINYEGKCGPLLSKVGDLNISPGSFDFFQLNPGPDYKTSGDGIVFYSEAFGINAGYYKVQADWISPYFFIKPEDIKFSYKGVSGVSEEEQEICQTFEDCPGSIDMKGNYLVIFRAGDSGEYCQRFLGDVPRADISWVLQEGRKFKEIVVVALK